MVIRGGGEKVREVILISGQNQNCPFFENGQFSGHFFFELKLFETNVKCYVEKVLKIFLTLSVFKNEQFGFALK